jgi:hypothetical protein
LVIDYNYSIYKTEIVIYYLVCDENQWNIFTVSKINDKGKENSEEEETLHVCKRHVDDTLDEETFMRLGGALQAVGALCYRNMSSTAFRVGSKYVMTAAHTVRDIVGKYFLHTCWSFDAVYIVCTKHVDFVW